MNIRIEMPDLEVEVAATLYEDRAPTVCRAVYDALSEPLTAPSKHACFAGHQVFCFLPGKPPSDLPVENNTVRSTPGDLMVFHAHENQFAWMHENKRLMVNGPGQPIWELAFNYGMTDLTYWGAEGWYGSLVGRVTSDLDQFASACAATLRDGSTTLIVRRDDEA